MSQTRSESCNHILGYDTPVAVTRDVLNMVVDALPSSDMELIPAIVTDLRPFLLSSTTKDPFKTLFVMASKIYADVRNSPEEAKTRRGGARILVST